MQYLQLITGNRKDGKQSSKNRKLLLCYSNMKEKQWLRFRTWEPHQLPLTLTLHLISWLVRLREDFTPYA